MRSERLCSLARFVMVDALNAPLTASVQWFERTLDDSANRRITLPEGFLATDAVLRLMSNISRGLIVNEKIIERDVRQFLPFIATENLLMASVEKGGDRQISHEIIRKHSLEVADRIKNGESGNLFELLANDPDFNLSAEEINSALNPQDFIGRCVEQVENFLNSFEIQYSSDFLEEEITL
jgi:adenylosuccinate lyase